MLVRDAPSLTAVIPATVHSGHSLQKHRQKDHVHANEGGPEMHFAPKLAHLSASCFREPVIDAGKKSEDRARRDDVMEMRDDVVGIVQIKIGRRSEERRVGKECRSEWWRGREKEKKGEVDRRST